MLTPSSKDASGGLCFASVACRPVQAACNRWSCFSGNRRSCFQDVGSLGFVDLYGLGLGSQTVKFKKQRCGRHFAGGCGCFQKVSDNTVHLEMLCASGHAAVGSICCPTVALAADGSWACFVVAGLITQENPTAKTPGRGDARHSFSTIYPTGPSSLQIHVDW